MNVARYSRKRWVITGGAGFVGVNLIRKLIEQASAEQIRVIDDLSAGSFEQLERCAEVQRLDTASLPPIWQGNVLQFAQVSIADRDAVTRLVNGADVIVHLAANTSVQASIGSPMLDAEQNVLGTLNVLEAARACGVKRFVFASSGAPTGRTPPPIHEEMPCKPMSPYGASKLAGEGYCSAYYSAFGINTSALRFSNVYGKYSGRKGSVIALFLRKAIAGEPWVINGDGSQTRDFIFVEDLVDAIQRAAELERGGEIFQISTGRETTISQLAVLMRDILHEEANIECQISYGPPLNGDIIRNYADNTKARRVLGWSPRWMLEDGARETVRWFLARQS